MPHASFPSAQASKSPTNDGRRRHAEDGEVDIACTHTTSPWRWDEHPGIEFWNIDFTLNYTDHNAPGNPKPALIARASLVRIDCSRCMEISFELDQFSFDLGRIGGAIDDSRDKLEPHQIYSATNSTILIAEDVVVDKFWRGRQLGPSLVVFAAELLRADGTFLMPFGLHTRLNDQGECYTDYWTPRPGPEVQKQVRAAWRNAGFKQLRDGIVWMPNNEEGYRDAEKRMTKARACLEKITDEVQTSHGKSWWWRRIERQLRTPRT